MARAGIFYVLIETLWNVKSGEGLGNSERAEWLFLGLYGN